MPRRVPQPPVEETRESALLRRARKHSLRGEYRHAMVAMREACLTAGRDPRLWALYGSHCWRARRLSEAAEALRQAIWLREREPNDRRADPLRALLTAVEEGRSANAA